MKTRQPLPACAGTAFNIVISLADPIRCGLSAALAAEIGWTRRLDATWAGYLEAATSSPLQALRAARIIGQVDAVPSDSGRLMRLRRRRGAPASSASIAANSFSMARADGTPSVSLR